MKKNDFIIVGILVALMFAWMNFYPAIEKKFFPRPEQPAAQAVPAADKPVVSAPVEKAAVIAEAAAVKAPEAVLPAVAEQRMTLSNDDIELTVSSYGGAVVSAVLKKYPETNRKDSGPAVLDFSAAPALRYSGLPVSAGILEKTATGLRYTAALGDNRFFERTLKLEGAYLLKIEDAFVNSSSAPWALPQLRLPTGPMAEAKGTTAMAGVVTLGVDSFAPAEGVHHWGKELNKLFGAAAGNELKTTTAEQIAPRPVDWIAAKNKFFVQILTPEAAAGGFDLSVRRAGEGKKNVPVEVAAALQFNAGLVAGNETVTRKTSAYIGPKDYSFLKTQGKEQVEVMEFKSTGFWKFMNPVMYPIKTGLLWGLKALEKVVRNYGVAIMLLTVIVRIIFWPITHKGTESMRKMQALQPQLKEIREKFKDNPQRMQQETMAFYKENKVNPMGGCLPMLIQIPVFIALFVVLRSAVELRFSKFLWIRDLSEPENLFAGMIPVVGSLNILPLLMSATMVLQQKMTPSAGDPQQQKMMAIMMPIMMLFFFYTMPSGLVLYWTTSNVIMIVQMMIKKQAPVAVK
ncbi:MAG TPA: membrane protein insertase YidC [Pontiellaceae bacterium]|nr:membrane protein insertase YidC [Pontiellaceae bacterium]